MKTFKIYLSHPIRGIERDVPEEVEHAIMKQNNAKAIAMAAALRTVNPAITIYCPAEHEAFVLNAYKNQLLTETQILDVDCMVIDACDAVLFFNHQGQLSNGMARELDHAILAGKVVLSTATIDSALSYLTKNLEAFLHG